MDINDALIDKVVNEDIFELLGVQDYPDEKKEEMKKVMGDTVLARSLARIYRENFSEEEKAKFSEMSFDEMLDSLTNKGIDLYAYLSEEALNYRVELVAAFNEINSLTKD